MSPGCRKCDGIGYTLEEKDGVTYSRPCSCQEKERATILHRSSEIPERYRNSCVLDRFSVPADNAALKEALEVARRYAEEYPVFEEGKPNGLLFIGPCGIGKTHLAVGVLNQILFKKKFPAKFVDLNDLYREIRASYGLNDFSEYDILAPCVDAGLLLIDELGCVASPWAQDTLLYLISQRYNRSLPTLLTTNYLDSPLQGEPSLAERIGVRARSRLYEMCRTVLMTGEDYRKKRKS